MTHTKFYDSEVPKKTQWAIRPTGEFSLEEFSDVMAGIIESESIDIFFLNKNQNNWCETANFIQGILSKRARFHDGFLPIAHSTR